MSYNLEINQGAYYTRSFTVLDPGNAVVNLTGYTVKAQMRKNPTSSDYIEFTAVVSNAAQGKVTITLAHTVTATLEGKYMYDIFLTDLALNRYKIGDGLITIVPNITRY